ncbi:hypothetical protein HPP92_014927 [Vanilla planifolia]|uniref:Uncharacterized protein n=1 Tax=Vanilla planifolia TaxID=51239 RepID=A0A835UXD2_VANPL|nr:hypothetical protein HPP92_014927 [Vanilla planifolia]
MISAMTLGWWKGRRMMTRPRVTRTTSNSWRMKRGGRIRGVDTCPEATCGDHGGGVAHHVVARLEACVAEGVAIVDVRGVQDTQGLRSVCCHLRGWKKMKKKRVICSQGEGGEVSLAEEKLQPRYYFLPPVGRRMWDL